MMYLSAVTIDAISIMKKSGLLSIQPYMSYEKKSGSEEGKS